MIFHRKSIFLGGALLVLLLSSFALSSSDWGFFAHRRINRLAVFTLPIELIPFYKKHIEYLTNNAVAPDKRRYAVTTEGIRHYMDLDVWGNFPFDDLPRTFVEASRKYVEILVINQQQDSLRLFGQQMEDDAEGNWLLKGQDLSHFFNVDKVFIDQEDYENFYYKHIYNAIYESSWEVECELLKNYFSRYDLEFSCTKAMAIDTFVRHGVLPYNLIRMQRSLTEAMRQKNRDLILRLSADIGHYIGDAHVPLHTTSNYNGYQTDQVGIHAFWETRLPELFADDTYDFLVGQAEYIDNPKEYYWQMVLNSHTMVKDVLQIEKELSQQFPAAAQDCFVERGATGLQKLPCYEYAYQYHEALQGQVEQQMRLAIHAVGNAWYTAWIDAGQPDFARLGRFVATEKIKKEEANLEEAIKGGEIKGRAH